MEPTVFYESNKPIVRWVYDYTKCPIQGVYSTYITPFIIASSRPSNDSIIDNDMVGQLIENKVGLVINLQEKNETDTTRDMVSGYAYSPSYFERTGIELVHENWRDMYPPPSLESVTNLLIKMKETELCGKKTFVHCLAGLSRTGMLVVCYLMLFEELDIDTAINFFNTKRKSNHINCNQYEWICNVFAPYTYKYHMMTKMNSGENFLQPVSGR